MSLADTLQRLHTELAEDLLSILSTRVIVYRKEIIDGVTVDVDTGETISAATPAEKTLILKLLAQNEIKAELEQTETMGRLAKKLASRPHMPPIEND